MRRRRGRRAGLDSEARDPGAGVAVRRAPRSAPRLVPVPPTLPRDAPSRARAARAELVLRSTAGPRCGARRTAPSTPRRYAAAAGDRNAVARLVAMHALPAYSKGWKASTAGSTGSATRRFSSVTPARRSSGVGSTRSAGARSTLLWFQAAESGQEASSIGPQVALLRAAFCRDGADRMLADAEAAVAGLPWTSRWRPTAVLLSGVAHLLRGDNDRADALFGRPTRWRPASEPSTSGVWRSPSGHCSRRRRETRRRPGISRPPFATSPEGGHGPYGPAAIERAAIAWAELRNGDWQAAREPLEERRPSCPC